MVPFTLIGSSSTVSEVWRTQLGLPGRETRGWSGWAYTFGVGTPGIRTSFHTASGHKNQWNAMCSQGLPSVSVLIIHILQQRCASPIPGQENCESLAECCRQSCNYLHRWAWPGTRQSLLCQASGKYYYSNRSKSKAKSDRQKIAPKTEEPEFACILLPRTFYGKLLWSKRGEKAKKNLACRLQKPPKPPGANKPASLTPSFKELLLV